MYQLLAAIQSLPRDVRDKLMGQNSNRSVPMLATAVESMAVKRLRKVLESRGYTLKGVVDMKQS